MNPTVAVGSRASAPSSIPRPARRTGTRQTGPEISSTSVSVNGVRMLTGRVGMLLVASATMMSASSFMACLKSGVRVRSSRSTASLWRLRGPSTTCRFFTSGIASFIERVCLGKRRHPLAQAVRLAARRSDDDAGDLAHLVLAHSARGHGRGAEPDAARDGRGLEVVRYHVLVAGYAHGLQRFFKLLAGDARLLQVDQDQVVVRPARNEVQPTLKEPVGQCLAVGDDLPGVVLELRLQRLAESDGLARDGVHQRAALHPWEDAAVHLLRELLAAEDHTPSGPA